MNKIVTLTLDDRYTVDLCKDDVSFSSVSSGTLDLPIEVFYQMWNSAEMIEHMEEYHRRRSEQ